MGAGDVAVATVLRLLTELVGGYVYIGECCTLTMLKNTLLYEKNYWCGVCGYVAKFNAY